jgi:integrase
LRLEQGSPDRLDAHALEIKPATLSRYRYLVTHYVNPHIGRMRLQAVRLILRKAFNDAVRSEQLLVTNPGKRAKRPRRGPKTFKRFGRPSD